MTFSALSKEICAVTKGVEEENMVLTNSLWVINGFLVPSIISEGCEDPYWWQMTFDAWGLVKGNVLYTFLCFCGS